ncbi:MAG: hypothetical protein ACOYIB_02260 [Desulfosporosinus sp.]|jgi:hypothetical protein
MATDGRVSLQPRTARRDYLNQSPYSRKTSAFAEVKNAKEISISIISNLGRTLSLTAPAFYSGLYSISAKPIPNVGSCQENTLMTVLLEG